MLGTGPLAVPGTLNLPACLPRPAARGPAAPQPAARGPP
jgi:hypothetical protein